MMMESVLITLFKIEVFCLDWFMEIVVVTLLEELEKLAMKVCKTNSMDEIYKLYDKVILLVCDPEEGLRRARSSKQEFKTGDAIENKGVEFQKQVYDKMFEIGKKFNPIIIDTSNKNKEQVFEEIKKALNL